MIAESRLGLLEMKKRLGSSKTTLYRKVLLYTTDYLTKPHQWLRNNQA